MSWETANWLSCTDHDSNHGEVHSFVVPGVIDNFLSQNILGEAEAFITTDL